MGVTIVLPALNRMDHFRPVVEYVRSQMKEKNPRIHVVFVPLKSSIQENLLTFVEDIVERKILIGINETYEVIEGSIEQRDGNWHDAWRNWISSIEFMSEGTMLSRIFVVLTPDTPNGVVLSTATAALSVPNLKIVELPVGYDLSLSGQEFKPRATLSEQITEYPTWGDVSIQQPILEISSKPEAGLTLAIIRNFAEKFRDRSELINRAVPRTEIKQRLLQYNRQIKKSQREIKDSALSQRLKTLKQLGLIERVPKSTNYVLTPDGVSVSGLFRNVWELQSLMDDRTMRGGS